MSLRKKLMLILLLTAILPMTAVRVIQGFSIYQLQKTVGADMRERLTRDAEQDMLRTVDGHAQSLEQQARVVGALLQAQASEVEIRLAGPVPDDPPRVPTAQEFSGWARSDPILAEIVESPRHGIVDRDGNIEPQPVSYKTQIVVPPNGNRLRPRRPGSGERERAAGDFARLADMTTVYRGVFEQADDIILWQYTSLESGLHLSYPGKGGLPPGYGPRKRSWYRQARAANRPISTPPYVDVSTRQLVITFAQPVRDPDGAFAGVTAIDLPLNLLLDPSSLNTDWSDDAQLIVVAAYPTRQPGASADDFEPGPDTSVAPDVYVLADVNQDPLARRRRLVPTTLGFDRDADRGQVREDLLNLRNGVQRVSIDGRDRMIAYGRIGADNERPVFALIIVPTDPILAPAERTIAAVNEDLRESLVTTGGIILVLLLVVGIVAFGLSDRLTQPIVQMAGASRRVAEGDLDARVEIDRKDELGQLGEAFNEMVPALRDRMKIRESLHVAMQVQQSLLPDQPPRIQGLDIAGHSEYCDETGGDYYDFIELDRLGPDTLGIAVGDVTGHGIAAALLMATGRALIRSHANTAYSLGEVFSAVNRQLCDSEFTGRFMTLMYLIVQSPSRCTDPSGCVGVRFLSAGHDPVIVYRPDDDLFIELVGNDIPLGIDPAWAFQEEKSNDLRPGDILVVGTDGIWECFNPEGEQFGKDRLRKAIRRSASGDAESIAHAISQACQAWRGDREQDDDITLVVVRLQ